MTRFSAQTLDRTADCMRGLRADKNAQAMLARWGEARIERLLLSSQFAVSRFSTDCERQSTWLDCEPDALCDPDRIHREFEAIRALDEPAAAVALRQLRQRILVGIAFADICLESPLELVLNALSATADNAIKTALDLAERSMDEKHGRVQDTEGTQVSFGVLAMGKLGGGELNFSSDIDLVFVYRANGQSDGERVLPAETYFLRLAQRFIRLLDEPTAAGRVYRVDVRLRPFGDSGPLVVSVDALESYLALHGREWERYAYLKARLLGGDEQLETELSPLLGNFVYRRYLDYGVFESLREMKAMIVTEVQRQSMAENIKLGPGGIREIEFIVQSLQLVRGGSEHTLRERNLLTALKVLRQMHYVSEAAYDELAAAYRYLRRLENRLQADRDQQVHEIPEQAEDVERLALAMGHASAAELATALNIHRQSVSAHFEESVVRGERKPAAGEVVWVADAAVIAASLDLAADHDLCLDLADFHRIVERKKLQPQSLDRLSRLMPTLTQVLVEHNNPEQYWRRLRPVLEAVMRRSAYLSLLIENPPALNRFVKLAGGHLYLAEELSRNPALLDELLDERIFQSAGTDGLEDECRSALARANTDDPESVMLALTEFQRSASFRTAVADVSGELGVMKVADRLTRIAELTIDETLGLAWQIVTKVSGVPAGASADLPAMCVIAYGKLGGLELAYGSDLDLVFLHDLDPAGMTSGHRPVATEVFFQRLVRKLTHLLTFQTRLGPLYEVDIRLRPSGRSGMLVTTTKAFERYQSIDAWTWEHQALVRARPVAGLTRVARQFDDIRRATLCRHVRRGTLAVEVSKMRGRMRRELDHAGPGHFDLKQSRGGLADLEFLVQYLVLANAESSQDVTTYPDNVRQLESLVDAEILTPAAASELTAAYLELRTLLNERTLAGNVGLVPTSSVAAMADVVIRHWNGWLGAADPDT